MTTNTEALRAQFEREIGEAAPFPVQRDGDSYINQMCAWAWAGYQAGHAYAKAETAAAVAAERERYLRDYFGRVLGSKRYQSGLFLSKDSNAW